MNAREYLKLFENFQDREAKLRAITRYSLYPVMFYRTSLWTHSKRVAWITEIIAPSAKKIWPDFDIEKAMLMALCHDDQEIIMGDIQAGNKAKMSPEQLAEIDKIERESISLIAKQFPEKLGNYNYQELLIEMAELRTPEAIVTKYADKMDGFGEALHEVFAGNPHFETNTVNEYGIIPTPSEYYLNYFNKFSEIFPITKMWLDENKNEQFIRLPGLNDSKKIMETGKLHTPESLKLKSNYAHYDYWKEMIMRQNDPEELANLYEQKEFL